MHKQEYKEKYQEHLLEQYKLYVQMMDNVSQRRSQTNAFYISVLSGLLVVLSIIIEKGAFSDVQHIVLFAVAILGMLLCYVWYINIQSYRQLNSGKFKIIHEMERELPFACFDKEWKILGEGTDKNKYLQVTSMERNVPILLAIPYALLFIYAVYHLISQP